MAKKKILVAVTNRSSYNKVKTVLQNLPNHIGAELLLGGSLYLYQYGEVGKIIEGDFPDLKVWKVTMMVDGDNVCKMPMSVAIGIPSISTIIDNNDYSLVVTIADRFETLATATSASYLNVPLAHIQGGEISGTIDDKVRNAITQLADYHFPATYDAADRVANMKPSDMERIWAYGCPSMDLMSSPGGLEECTDFLNRHGTGDDVSCYKPYIVVMMHPDTTGEPINEEHMSVLCEALNNFGCQKIIFWNNIDPGGDIIAKAWRMSQHGFWKDKVRYVRHAPPEIFAGIMKRSSMIIGNSSAGIREATFLGTPSLTVGDRQKGRDRGINVVDCGFEYSDIMAKLNDLYKSIFVRSDMYGNGDAGAKIAMKIGDIVHG